MFYSDAEARSDVIQPLAFVLKEMWSGYIVIDISELAGKSGKGPGFAIVFHLSVTDDSTFNAGRFAVMPEFHFLPRRDLNRIKREIRLTFLNLLLDLNCIFFVLLLLIAGGIFFSIYPCKHGFLP